VSAGNGVNPKRRKSTRPYRDSALAYAALGSLVVVGDLAARPNLGDLGSSTVIPTSAAVVPLDGIRAAAGAVPVTHVTSMPLSPEDQAAVAAADAAIVVAGLTSDD